MLAEGGALDAPARAADVAALGAHACRWRPQLAFAHALVLAADGAGAGALRGLLTAAVDGQRVIARTREACVRAEGALLRALYEAAEDVSARVLPARAELVAALDAESRRCAERVRELARSAAAAGKEEEACARAVEDADESCALVCRLLARRARTV